MKLNQLTQVLIFSFFVIVAVACDKSLPEKQWIIEKPFQNPVLTDSGKVTFYLPHNFSESEDMLAMYKNVMPEALYLAVNENEQKGRYILVLSKLEGPEIMPAEVAFVEYILKYNLMENEEETSQMKEFGAYERDGKLYRYKITQWDKMYKVLYYFMENERSLYMYELSMIYINDDHVYADSILRVAAYSFAFVK